MALGFVTDTVNLELFEVALEACVREFIWLSVTSPSALLCLIKHTETLKKMKEVMSDESLQHANNHFNVYTLNISSKWAFSYFLTAEPPKPLGFTGKAPSEDCCRPCFRLDFLMLIDLFSSKGRDTLPL